MMDQRYGLFRVFGKSVRTKSLPFWHGRPLENIVHRRRLHACGRRGCLHYCRTTFSVCPNFKWPVNMFLRVRVLGGISFRTRHRSTETLETVHGVGECQCMYRVVPFFSVHTHTSSSTTANTRDRCLLPCRSITFSRLTLSGSSGLSRLTASRAIFLIRWRARLLIVGLVLCISPLGAELARVAGRSSLQRMRFSEFFLSVCVSFMCILVFFFAHALWM